MTAPLRATVVGGSGYAGGELLRLLADHPEFEVVQTTSRTYEQRTVGHVHPNLRDLSLRFSDPSDLVPVDILFSAIPHGEAMERIEAFREAAGTVVDLSADFRLETPQQYEEWYDGHSAPEHLSDAVYALPEMGREGLAGASLIAAGGCNATAALLALQPLADEDLLTGEDRIVVDLKVGSSEGGAESGKAGSHVERTGVVRPYAPTGHRHEAEIQQQLGLTTMFTVHAVDMTRGVAATCHTFPDGAVTTADLWNLYRDTYEDEPFVRIVAGGGEVHRYPEPKAVAGTNHAEVGFAVGPSRNRVVLFAAIDNVMKGAAGQAVHAANLALGLDETAGLGFRGLHPVGAP